MRLALLLFVLLLAGCCGTPVNQPLADGIIHGPNRNLPLALYAYREGSGRWPSSAEALGAFVAGELHLDRYENLRFDPLADGGLAVTFDRYVSPDGRMTCSDYRLELGKPPAH